MALGNLAVNVSANISAFRSGMEQASRLAADNMGAAEGSVDDFRTSILRASTDLQRAALQMGSGMQAANDSITSSSKEAAAAINNIGTAANNVDTKSLGEKIATAIGVGVGLGLGEVKDKWNDFAESTKSKAAVVGLAIGAIMTAVGLGAIYTAYKVISGSLGFITGLITGDSYKSESIDALIKANDQVKEIQQSLQQTAQQASATRAALASLGVDKNDYTSVYQKATEAIHSNVEELDRLGVSHKNEADLIQSANKVLNEYTDGWDRNQAAQAIGIGTAAQVAQAASVTAEKVQQAADRLNDYNIGIGDESQAAVKRYEDAMRDFNRETQLTSDGFKRAWADQIMPILTDLAEFFKDGFPLAVNAFRYSMATVASLFYGLKEVAYLVSESVIASISSIGSILGGVASANAKLITGDFAGAKNAIVQGWEDAKNRIGQAGDNIVAQSKRNMDAMRLAWAADDRKASPAAAAKKKGKTWVPAPEEDDSSAATQRQDPFASAMTAAKSQLAGMQYVIDNFDKFQGKVKESKAAMAEFDVTMGKFSDEQRKQEGFAPLTEAQKQGYIALNKQLDDATQKERTLQEVRQFGQNIQQYVYQQQQMIAARQQDVDWMGKSEQELAKLTAARQIDAQIAAMIHAEEIKLGPENVDAIKAQTAALLAQGDTLKAQSAAVIDAGYSKAKDPWFNAQNSLRQYGEEAQNVGQQIGQAMQNAFHGAEDAFVNFVMTGKLSFSDLARSILADLARIQAKNLISSLTGGAASSASGGIGSMIAGLFGSKGYQGAAGANGQGSVADFMAMDAQGFADGGEPPLGKVSWVGERGPELFVPKQAGTVIPNHLLGGGGQSKITIINQTTGRIDNVTEQQISPTERAIIIQEAVNATAAQMGDPNSRVSRSLGRNYTTQRSR